MMKITAVLLFVVSLASAFRNSTRHIIHQEVFLKRPAETRQSSCDLIIADCKDRIDSIKDQYDTSAVEGRSRYLSDATVLACESCLDDFERYYSCTGEYYDAEVLREANCARSDVNGKYCGESFFDGVANGDLSPYVKEGEEISRISDTCCISTCQDLHNILAYFGCCASSFQQYGLLLNTTQQFDDCGATLGEPCSGVFATPAFLVIAVLALITFSFF